MESGGTFSSNTTLYAHWTASTAAVRYWIYTPDRTPGGSFYISHSSAAEGSRVTIEPSPRSGYTLDWLAVTNLDTGRELRLSSRGEEYAFTMPAADVEVELSFVSKSSDNTDYAPVYTPTPAQAGKSRLAPWYYSNGFIYHVTDGLVPTDNMLTRDMLISVLYNMDNTSSGEPEIWATSHGVIPDIFASVLWGRDKAITREQTAMILYCYAKHMGYPTFQSANLAGYSDYRQINSIALPAMSWARATDLITGTSASTLSPRSLLTCGQGSTILSRFVANVV